VGRSYPGESEGPAAAPALGGNGEHAPQDGGAIHNRTQPEGVDGCLERGCHRDMGFARLWDAPNIIIVICSCSMSNVATNAVGQMHYDVAIDHVVVIMDYLQPCTSIYYFIHIITCMLHLYNPM
jgi:hypothetical protein